MKAPDDGRRCFKKALVTGGGGYVGSTLCRRLVERGYVVTAFDCHYPDLEQEDDVIRIKVIK